MDIATNAVLAAMLIQASEFVKNIDLPVPRPLERSNVVAFRVGVSWNQADSDLGGYIAYKGGYEFRFSHGHIDDFNTRESYTDLQRPEDLPLLTGEVRFSESECLLKARQALENLGYRDNAVLNPPPEVNGPIAVKGGIVPRFIFRWPRAGSPKFSDARIEVNASRLTIEHLYLGSPAFWRKSWPITFGSTNTLQQLLGAPSTPEPKRSELEVHDVSCEFGMAYLNAILPQISQFCSRLGPPFPSSVTTQDVSLGESEVAVKFGRISASLRLKSGYLIVFVAGHVWAVHAPDAYYTSPWWKEEMRQCREYLEPTNVSQQDAVEKVRRLLLEHIGLNEKDLFLDTDPVFSLRPNPAATNGIRRYVFQWQRPETREKTLERQRNQLLPEASVSAEVDAVSGEIKTLNFFHRSLERPDPKVDVPENLKADRSP